MTSLTTEDFPYTITYVMELLGLEERELMGYVQLLNMTPRKDEKTGRLIFTHRDIDALKKAHESKKQQGVQKSGPAEQSVRTSTLPIASVNAAAESESGQTQSKMGYMSPASQSMRPASNGKDNISVMVEAVSQVKEGILKDLSRLLDDKLSGLDEVVVELIRCKSENDSLKKKLDEVARAKETLEYELSRFKPVQFGFYRKT